MKKIVSKYSFNNSFTEKTMLSKTIPIRVVSGQGAIPEDWNSIVWTSCFGHQGLTLPSLPQMAVRSSAVLHKCLSCPWLVLQFLLSSKEIYTVVKTVWMALSALWNSHKMCQERGVFGPRSSVGCLGRDSLRNRWSYFKTFKKNSWWSGP